MSAPTYESNKKRIRNTNVYRTNGNVDGSVRRPNSVGSFLLFGSFCRIVGACTRISVGIHLVFSFQSVLNIGHHL